MCECKGGYTCPAHAGVTTPKSREKRGMTIRQALAIVEAGKIGRRFSRSVEMAKAAKVLMGAFRAANNSGRSAGSLAKAYTHFSSNGWRCGAAPKKEDDCYVGSGIRGYYVCIRSTDKYLDTYGVPQGYASWFPSEYSANQALAIYKKTLGAETPNINGYNIQQYTNGWSVYVIGKGYLMSDAVTISPGMLSGGHWWPSESAAREAASKHQRAEKDGATKWQSIATSVSRHSITIERRTASKLSNSILGGAITASEISEAYQKVGFPVNVSHVYLTGPIQELGYFTVKLKFHEKVWADAKVWVVPAAQ